MERVLRFQGSEVLPSLGVRFLPSPAGAETDSRLDRGAASLSVISWQGGKDVARRSGLAFRSAGEPACAFWDGSVTVERLDTPQPFKISFCCFI